MKDFVVLDCETSGLNPQFDQIIEFCMIRVRDGEPTTVYNTLVQYDKPLNQKVIEITGHTDEELKGGITEQQLCESIMALITTDDVLVAYNATFDLSFLEKLFQKYRSPGLTIINPILDPLTIARDRHQYPHKLGDMCRKYGITLENAHSAYDDTFALLDLVQALDEEKRIAEYVNVLGYLRKWGEPEWVPAHATLKPQGFEVSTRNLKGAPLRPNVNNVVVTKNTARKRKPTDPVDATTIPTGLMLDKGTLEQVDTFINRQEFVILRVRPDELEAVKAHMVARGVNLDEDEIETFEDAQGNIVIEWFLPF